MPSAAELRAARLSDAQHFQLAHAVAGVADRSFARLASAKASARAGLALVLVCLSFELLADEAGVEQACWASCC